jgi:hypothetical protein
MTRPDRPRRPRLQTILAALDVVDLIAGSRLRHAGAGVVMMATALVGCAVLAAALGLAGILIVVLGVSRGPSAWLGNAILWTGVIVGFGGAVIVMWKIIRRRPAWTALAGFDDLDGPHEADEADPAESAPPGPPPIPMTAERLLALDSRLSDRPPAADAARDESGDSSDTRP